MTVRTNPQLWERIKAQLLKRENGKWSARLAQEAVRLYKSKGGGYIGAKDPNNSLAKWSRENWGYAGKPKQSRYLPEKVRKAMPKSLKEKENRLKGGRLGQNVPYTPQLVKLMKEKGVL